MSNVVLRCPFCQSQFRYPTTSEIIHWVRCGKHGGPDEVRITLKETEVDPPGIFDYYLGKTATLTRDLNGRVVR